MITALQVVISIILSLFILLQHRASGLSATFGGSGAIAIQRRGAERFIFVASIWLSVAFFGLTILEWYVKF
ncbi:MAG: preprotein translocase subunit SecG [Candidatus Peribacteraceae bacterium]|jgi:protein translocase SecG subunit